MTWLKWCQIKTSCTAYDDIESFVTVQASCVRPSKNPEDRFSHDVAQIRVLSSVKCFYRSSHDTAHMKGCV